MLEKWKRTPKFKVRKYSRCLGCRRPRAVFRKFGLWRIGLRELAHRGEIPGVVKASWSSQTGTGGGRGEMRGAWPPRSNAALRAPPRVRGGMGVVILTSSRGVMTDRQARRLGVGGEVICYVW